MFDPFGWLEQCPSVIVQLHSGEQNIAAFLHGQVGSKQHATESSEHAQTRSLSDSACSDIKTMLDEGGSASMSKRISEMSTNFAEVVSLEEQEPRLEHFRAMEQISSQTDWTLQLEGRLMQRILEQCVEVRFGT